MTHAGSYNQQQKVSFVLIPSSYPNEDGLRECNPADRPPLSVRSHQSPCRVTHADKDTSSQRTDCSVDRRGGGGTSRREYGPPVLHSDGIHDLKWGLKIYETCHRIEKELKKKIFLMLCMRWKWQRSLLIDLGWIIVIEQSLTNLYRPCYLGQYKMCLQKTDEIGSFQLKFQLTSWLLSHSYSPLNIQWSWRKTPAAKSGNL